MKSKIKPCPWCGSKRIDCVQMNDALFPKGLAISAICRKCKAASRIGYVKTGQGILDRIENEGIKLWNARKGK